MYRGISQSVSGRVWDAAVIGAGPAGALAARELSRRGLSALLIEKKDFPRRKVCGCCFNPSAMRSLESVGLGNLLGSLVGSHLHSFHLGVGHRHINVTLPPGYKALCRSEFDTALVDSAIKAGTVFLSGTTATLGEIGGERRTVNLHRNKERCKVDARVVLIASGLTGGNLLRNECPRTSVMACSKMGAGCLLAKSPSFYRPHMIYMAAGTYGYVGLVRMENGFLNLAAAIAPHRIRLLGSLEKTVREILDEAGLPPIPSLLDTPIQGTPLLTRRLDPPSSFRLFVLGDAAGYVEPFTGEGIAHALAEGLAVVEPAVQAVEQWDESLSSKWTAYHRKVINRHQRASRVIAGMLRHPILIQSAAILLTVSPKLGMPIFRRLNSPLEDYQWT